MSTNRDSLDQETLQPERPPSVHWLIRIAERAGLEGESIDLAAGVSAPDAWAAVVRAYGLSDARLSELVADYFRLDVADFAHADPNAALLVPETMARRHHIFPLLENDRQMVVATCDPTDVEAERALGFSTGRSTVFEVASPQAIQEAIDGRFSPEKAVGSLLGTLEADMGLEADTVRLVEEMGPEAVSEDDVQATPVVKLTNLIIRDGIAQGASDIHIEPGRKGGSVRYRVDGVLRKHMDLPMSALNRVISRIKILSKLDIADRLRPQDGKARVRIKNLGYDLRVSTLPAGGAEKCVIRILDSSASLTLDDLDLPAKELERMRSLLTNRDGIVVVTGPTGSGKTTTLYGALRELADGKVNIMTVEDPIEYDLPAITQTQVEAKQGLTFSTALRSILRQDPDVILVGEIRDRETAETAAQAAMTGHLVLATVHANDAVSAVARLADMGLQFSTIAQTLRGGLAQRLIRRVCAACAEPVRGMLTPDERRLTERHGMEPVVRAVGCPECGFTGYRGRLPVVEVLIAGPRFAQAVEQRKGWATLSRLAIQGGMRPMQQVVLEWVAQGKTTLVEVERVLGQQVEDEQGPREHGPPRILLVDDDEEARLFMRTLLEKEDFEVLEALDGEQALDILKGDPDFSLIILDLQMPGLDGREVLHQIRNAVDTGALPVLIRTGTGSDRMEAELLDAGADDYLDKSVDPGRFLARVKAILRRAML
ncbi:MAG: Flp pilus assembly complex ATPase component TadA [Gemmatimonadetes bacterium]|nr:Flp pilus assembly complex ATPase component TadA [Gemmatimonadota bacterium]